MSEFLFDLSEYDPNQFEMDSFRDVIAKHWNYLGFCNGMNFSVYQRDDDVWQIEMAPPMQIVYGGKEDGMTVWCPFEFHILEFLNEPDIEEITVAGAMTYSLKENSQPFLCFLGTFRGMKFALRICLVPFANAKPTEIISNEVRCIEEEST